MNLKSNQRKLARKDGKNDSHRNRRKKDNGHVQLKSKSKIKWRENKCEGCEETQTRISSPFPFFSPPGTNVITPPPFTKIMT
jgi:hypothetical protein